jgi:hypothetical protein
MIAENMIAELKPQSILILWPEKFIASIARFMNFYELRGWTRPPGVVRKGLAGRSRSY